MFEILGSESAIFSPLLPVNTTPIQWREWDLFTSQGVVMGLDLQVSLITIGEMTSLRLEDFGHEEEKDKDEELTMARFKNLKL